MVDRSPRHDGRAVSGLRLNSNVSSLGSEHSTSGHRVKRLFLSFRLARVDMRAISKGRSLIPMDVNCNVCNLGNRVTYGEERRGAEEMVWERKAFLGEMGNGT